jgi:hypothetical protein
MIDPDRQAEKASRYRAPARLATIALFAGLLVWRITHPKGKPWTNADGRARWGEPE